MSPEDDTIHFADDELAGFVPVMFVPTVEEAERLRDLLEDHDIPSSVGADEGVDLDADAADAVESIPPNPNRGTAVLVPRALLDEAQEIVADIEDSDEFVLSGDEEEEQEENELDFVEPIEPDTEDVFEDQDDLLPDIEEDDESVDDDPEEHI